MRHVRVNQVVLVCIGSVAFMLGIGVAAYVNGIWWWQICCLALGCILLWRQRSILLLIMLTLTLFGFGVLRGTEYAQKYAAYKRLEDQKVVLVGVAASDAVYGQRSQLTFTLRDTQSVTPEQAELVGTQEVSGFGEPMVYKGQIVKVSGKLRLSRGNNSARLSYAQIEILGGRSSLVDDIRRNFAAGIQSSLPEPAASFGMGILVGQRNTLPEDVTEHLKAVGLTHIIAVSGYNLTVIMRAAQTLFGKRSKYQFMVFSIVLISLFLLIAGGSPSIVRASVVCGLGLAAWYYGRNVSPMVLLLLSGAITAWMNPLYVWGNVSWYLSFLAFFGVLIVAPVVVKRFFSKKEPGLIKMIVIESLCAEAATLPYVLWVFGQFSLVGILGNTLVVAFIPLAMLLTLFAGLAGLFIPFVAGWFAWPASILLTYMLDIAQVLSKTPHGFMDGITFPTSLMVFSYAILCAVLCLMHYKSRQNYAIITDKATKNLEGV